MDYGLRKERKVHPWERSNLLSRITFFYTRGLFWKSYTKKKIEEKDLYDVVSSYRSQVLGDQLEEHVKDDLNNYGNVSIYRILWSCYGKEYLCIGIIQLLMRMVIVTMIPMALSKVVLYFKPGQNELTKREACFFAALLVGFNLLNIIYTHNYMLTITALGIRVRTAFCSLMFRKSLRLTPSALSDITMGKIVTLMTKDVAAFEMIILYGNDVWIGFVQAGIVCYLIYRKMGFSAFVGVGFFLIVLPIQIFIGKRASALRMKAAKKTDERLQVIQETLSAIKIVKMYSWEDYFKNKIFNARKKEVNTIVKIFLTKIMILLIGALTSKLAFYFLVMTYVWLGYAISAELVYFILTLFQRLRHALSVIIPLGITESAELYAAVERIGNLLKADDTSGTTEEPITTKPKISMKQVTVNINNTDVLKSITMTVESGLTIITGPIGSGKTVLLETLLKTYATREGMVYVSGRVSYVSQEPWIFPSTLKQNIIFGERLDQTRYEEVLRVCALNFDIEQFEGGDSLIIGDKGINLSKGQKARINLARAVYKESDIYLLDDCLSALDQNVKEYIFRECIRGFLKDKLCILVTHNVEYIKNSDNVIIMEKGTIKSISKSTDINENDKIHFGWNENEKLNDTESEKSNIDECDNDDEGTRLLKPDKNPVERNIYHEEKKSGKVKAAVYNEYIRYGGGYIILIVIILFFVVTQFSKSYTEKMVSNWVDLEQNISLYKVANLTKTAEYTKLSTTHSFILILFSALIGATTILSIITAYLFFNFTRNASNKLNRAMVDNIVNAVMSFFDTNFIGNILNRFSKDLATIDEQMPFVLYEFLEFTFALSGIIILIASVNIGFLVPVTSILLILLLIRRIYMPTGRNLQRLDTSTRSPIIGYLNASLEGLTTVRACNAQSILAEQFDKHQDLYTSTNFTLKCCTRAFGFAMDLFCSLFIAVIVIYFLAFDKETSVGNVGLAITQAFMLSGLVQYGIRQWADLENKMTSVERVLEYTTKDEEVKNVGSRPQNWPASGKIRYKNVSLLYQNAAGQILKNMDFVVEGGQKIGIVGRTGAGKTSIVSTLLRLYSFEGKITVDDIDVTEVSLEYLRKSVSVIPQDPVLFTGTIRTNIDPMGACTDEEIWSVIEKVKLHDLVTSLDLKVTDSGSNFSTGQKQLLCLARAIISKNKIVVLDEASANVDHETALFIYEVIREHFSSCTVLTIAHRLDAVLNSDKIMVVDNGRIVEYDRPETLLMNRDGHLYRIVKKSGLLEQ